MKTQIKIKRYAFWKYDLFPYMLSGEIESRCGSKYPGKEYYCIKGYGNGHYFKPFLIVRGKKGEKLKNEVDNLRNEYRLAEIELKNNFKDRLRKMNSKFVEIVK